MAMGYDSQIAKAEFFRHTSGHSGNHDISTFECKCAVIATIGIELPLQTIRQKVRYYNRVRSIKTLVYSEISDEGRVSFDAFLYIIESEARDESNFVKAMFSEVDKRNRGYVEDSDFLQVLW